MASFGTGVAFSNSQARVNPSQSSDFEAFGAGNPAKMSDTGQFENISNAAGTRGAPTGALAAPKLIEPSSRTSTTTNSITKTLGEIGSTKMGYQDLAAGHNGFGGGGMMQAAAPAASPRQLLAKIPMGKAPSGNVLSRKGEFEQGQSEAKPQLPGSPTEPGPPTEPPGGNSGSGSGNSGEPGPTEPNAGSGGPPEPRISDDDAAAMMQNKNPAVGFAGGMLAGMRAGEA